MISTTFLAQYLGILMLALGSVSLIRNRVILQWVRKVLRKPSVFFLVGVFEFMVALLIVLGHQQWGSFGAGLVSVIGWLMLAESILYLTLPQASLVHLLAALDDPVAIQGVAIVTVGLGVTLTLIGFEIV